MGDTVGRTVHEPTDRFKDALTLLVGLDARLATLELWEYTVRYKRDLTSHLVRRFRSIELRVAGEVESLAWAVRRGEISRSEWDKVLTLDVFASAIDIGQPDRPKVFVTVDLALVIDPSDVERARERADILGRALDLPVVACVDGEAILRDAEFRAAELGVVNLRG